MFTITPIVVSSFISMVVYIMITIVAWQRRHGLSGYYFAMWASCNIFWMAMVTLGYAATSVSLKVFFATLDALGYLPGFSFLLLFALSFTGYEHITQKSWVKAIAVFFFIPTKEESHKVFYCGKRLCDFLTALEVTNL